MAVPSQVSEEQIRERAYALWESEGRPDARSEEFWERAERELKSEAHGAVTLIASFDSEERAQAVMRDLEQSGIRIDGMRQHLGAKGAAAIAPQDQSSGSLMDWLLGEESPVRDKSIYEQSKGNVILGVSASSSLDASKIEEILHAHGPSSVEQVPGRI